MKETSGFIVITGASSGIGSACARAFAARGFHLILTARHRRALEDLRQEILLAHPDLQVHIFTHDLSLTQEAHAFYEEIRSFPLTALIIPAGSSICQK